MSHAPQRFFLSNGLPVLVLERHGVAVATADVWVRTGSADEPAELSGVSHFLEHMLFKGTDNFGLGEIERQIERHGGQSNAATSHDYTHYYITLPSEHLGLAIGMLAEMTGRSTLDAAELEKERLVILEEYRRKQDHPAGVLFERLYAELFAAGRYHDPVIGYEETIKSISREGMLDYYRRRYTPESLALVLTGDVTPEQAREAAEKSFGAQPSRPAETLRPAPDARLGAGTRVRIEKATGGELYVAFAWPAPGLGQGPLPGSGDPAAIVGLDAAQFILGQGRAARLYQNLKEKRGLCSSIGAHYPAHAAESMFAVTATCLPEQIEPLREAVTAELEAWLASPPDEESLTRARRLLASAHRFGMETSHGAASEIGYYYTLTGSTGFVEDYERRLAALDGESVLAAARLALPAGRVAGAMVETAVGPAVAPQA